MSAYLLLPFYTMPASALVADGRSAVRQWPGGPKSTVHLFGTGLGGGTLTLDVAERGSSNWFTLFTWTDEILSKTNIEIDTECDLSINLAGSSGASVQAKIVTPVGSRFNGFFNPVDIPLGDSVLAGVIKANTYDIGVRGIYAVTDGGIPTAKNIRLELIRNAAPTMGGTTFTPVEFNSRDATAADLSIYQGATATGQDAHDSTAAVLRRRFHPGAGFALREYFNNPIPIKAGDALAVWLTGPDDIDIPGAEVAVELEQSLLSA